MEHSESLAALGAALAAAQGEIENAHTNAENKAYARGNGPGYKYANLAEILNTARPVLAKHGLAVVQAPMFADGICTVETMLLHKSGEWLSFPTSAPVQKADPQGVGSATTYLRRYSLAALCGMAQEDDDGESAVQRGNGQQARQGDRERGNGQGGAASRTNGRTTTREAAQPWDRELTFGHNKGKKLGDLDEATLAGLIDWCRKSDNPEQFADLVRDAEATQKRHAGAGT